MYKFKHPLTNSVFLLKMPVVRLFFYTLYVVCMYGRLYWDNSGYAKLRYLNDVSEISCIRTYLTCLFNVHVGAIANFGLLLVWLCLDLRIYCFKFGGFTVCVHIQTNTHKYTHTQIHTHTYTYTHTHAMLLTCLNNSTTTLIKARFSEGIWESTSLTASTCTRGHHK